MALGSPDPRPRPFLAASVASTYSAQYRALNPDFSGMEEVFNNKVQNPSFPIFQEPEALLEGAANAGNSWSGGLAPLDS